MKKKATALSRTARCLSGLLLSLGLMAPAVAQDPVNLTLWFTDSRSQYKTWLDNAAAEYKKTNPHVNVDVVQMTPNDAYVKWPAAVASGTTPDITWMFYAFSAWINDLPGGELVAMDDVVERLGADNFHEDGLKDWRYKDKYIGVPFTRQPFFLLWRKDMFEEAGLEEPKTWDDVIEAAKTLHDPRKGRYGIALGGKNDWTIRQNFELVLYSNGGHLLTQDGKAAFNDDIAREAVDIYTELFQYTPPGSLNAAYAEVNRTFAQGTAAMAISLPVAATQFAQANPDKKDVVGAVIPSNANLAMTMQNNKGWSIFASSTEQEEAKKFIEFLYTTEQYTAGLEAAALGGLPLYFDEAATAKLLSDEGPLGNFPDVRRQLQADYSGYYSGIDWYGPNPKGGLVGSQGVLERNLNNHLARKRDSAETVAAIQAELEEIFND